MSQNLSASDWHGITKMSKGIMWRSNRKAMLAGLVAIVILAAGLPGCTEGIAPQQRDAFITDRVVEVRIVMREEDWTASRTNALAKQYVRADFWFDGELVPDVAVRPKGNSSLRSVFQRGSPRLSLKVDFNFFNAARTFRGVKKLNFNNGFKDPTLIRERIAYGLFDYMGIPTPRNAFVDLWVNDTHLGLYTQVEQIDQTFLRQNFPKFDGNLYKPEPQAVNLKWTVAELEKQRTNLVPTREADAGDNLDVNLGGGRLSEILRALQEGEAALDQGAIPNPPEITQGQPGGQQPQPGQPRPQGDYLEAMGLKTNENSPDHSLLFRLLDVINKEPDETFPEEIEEVLDVDGALRWLAVSTLLVHLDNYIGSGHNYYLYETDNKFKILAWDMNETFGTFTTGISREGLINYYIDEPSAGPIANYPLVQRLVSYPPYLDTYHKYLEELLDGPFAVDAMESRIDEFASLIRPYVKSDNLKFSSTSDFERSLVDDVTPYIGLKSFVIERSESVRQQLAGTRTSTGNGQGNGATRLGGGGRQPDDRQPQPRRKDRQPGDRPPPPR